MPALANVILTDRASTPVNHTFAPRDLSNGVAVLVESTGVPVGDSVYTISLRKTVGSRYKVTSQLTVPIVQTETINGIASPKVVRQTIVKCTFDFEGTSTEQERKDAVGMFASSLLASNTFCNDINTKLQAPY